MITYTFEVYNLKFEIVAEDDDSAQRAASIKLLQDKLVDPGTGYQWVVADSYSPEIFHFHQD